MNFNYTFLNFLILSLSFGCGVKSDPIPPPGSKPLVPVYQRFLHEDKVENDAGSEQKAVDEASKKESE